MLVASYIRGVHIPKGKGNTHSCTGEGPYRRNRFAGHLFGYRRLFFNSLGKSTPEGVDADAITLRSVTLSGDDYEVVTIEEELYELPIDSTPAHEITEGSRDFLSRNRDELWLTSDTVERLGVEGLDVIGGEAE